jgi:2-polyprenyl-6-methoxyphenol hydroxylase-like FAD-dependent oxidoreductase
VGAGPAGLLLGLQLARNGIEVVLLDMGETVDHRPRAAHYATPAVHELLKAGILDDVIERGFRPHGVCWRRINGELLTTLDQTVVIEDPMAMVCLPLGLLGALMVEHAAKYPNMTIHWGHEVTSISQDDKSARVAASTKVGEKIFEGTYVVGCDGANSKVRRELLGEWNFPGHTWDEWVVATNVLTSLYFPLKIGLLSI